MNYIVHLTEKCNMNCKYCYEKKMERDISFENIKKLVDYIVNTEKSERINFAFYGGEPLLKFNVIKDTIEYINSKNSNIIFNYSITTNGTLINEEIIRYMKENHFLFIQYSIDGTKESHNLNRVLHSGDGTFDLVYENAKKVLKNFDNVIANKVITKNNIKFLGNDVNYLIKYGFKNLYLLFDYGQEWDDSDLIIIKEELRKVAETYANEIMKENDVEISLIDEKIRTYIDDSYNCNEDCKMGMRTINVGTDGNFYPCMQFVGDNKYVIGNCEEGIDYDARIELIKSSKKEIDTCKDCELRKRCKHTCSCKNYAITKDINKLSPFVCELERIIIEISDEMAEKLYKNNSKMFIQKYYNKNYDILKYIEKHMEEKRYGNKKGRSNKQK